MSGASRAVIDIRSDTVTRPTEAMRRAMLAAPLGDACYGEDPTVNRLEAAIAERLGKERAIFVPSGTMSNQLGIGVHTLPGDAVLASARSHVVCWEGAGLAANSGLQLVGVAADDGLPPVEALEAALFPTHAKAPRVRVLAVENTHNQAGGVPHGPRAVAERADWARSRGLATHLDGARLFNAAVAQGVEVRDLAQPFDTVSVCFSKGLGAPVGSAIVGPGGLLERADRMRHRLGGGWRQGGMLAAAALHALDHHVERLADDHAHAKALAEGLAATGVARTWHEVRTNMVRYDVEPTWGTSAEFESLLAGKGVLVDVTGPQTGRLVTHLDLDDDDVMRVLAIFRSLS